jgi:hypothetical protein
MTRRTTSPRARHLSHLVVAAMLGVVAFALVLAATDPPGPGLDPDAMAYMGAAESLAAGAGYRVPAAGWRSADSTAALTHFPPGYSTALALPIRLGMAPPRAPRLVNATAAAVTITVVVLLVSLSTTLVAGALLGLALLVMPAMELVHLSVLSEPLFLACVALTLAAMVHPRGGSVAVGIAAAAGALTRYAGVALIGAGVLWAFAERGSLAVRLRRAAMTLLPAVLLEGAWMIRTARLHEPAEIRHFALYGRLGPTLAQGGATIRDWLVPDPGAWSDPMPYRPALALAASLVVIALLSMGGDRALQHERARASMDWRALPIDLATRVLAACGLLALCYLGMLVASRLFADPGIPFDERILAPFLLLASVGIATATALWWRATRRVLPRIALGVALSCWWVASATTTGHDVGYALDWGSDFAGEQWRRSEVLDWARTAGQSHPLYTNWPAALYFHLHRASRSVPLTKDSTDLPAFVAAVRATNGRVLMFSVADVDYLTRASLLRQRGFRIIAELGDGVVLDAAP